MSSERGGTCARTTGGPRPRPARRKRKPRRHRRPADETRRTPCPVRTCRRPGDRTLWQGRAHLALGSTPHGPGNRAATPASPHTAGGRRDTQQRASRGKGHAGVCVLPRSSELPVSLEVFPKESFPERRPREARWPCSGGDGSPRINTMGPHKAAGLSGERRPLPARRSGTGVPTRPVAPVGSWA